MQMRPSRVLRKLRNNEIVTCTKINLADPRVVEIASICGFDCVWLDMEHVPSDWTTIENQIRAAKMYDVDTLVRVRRGCYSDYIQPLEADAAGIMVPHIMSLSDAQGIVRQTRFHPIGRRPIDGGNSDGAYCMIPMADYIASANTERFVIVQIEDPEPLDDLERIADLEGIDMLLFGPGDFSQGIGTPGQMDNPEIADTRKRIARTCRKYGKFAGTVGGPGNFKELVDMGYQFISTGADVVALWTYYNDILSKIGTTENSTTDTIYKGK